MFSYNQVFLLTLCKVLTLVNGETKLTGSLVNSGATRTNVDLESTTASKVLKHCRQHFNISCACMKHLRDKVVDFSCLNVTTQSCNTDSCQICTRGGLINTCTFTDFFNGCYTDCMCSCGSSNSIAPVFIKCRNWCKEKQSCSRDINEVNDFNCNVPPKNVFGGLLNIIWVTLCALLLYHFLRRRNHINAWMQNARAHNSSGYSSAMEFFRLHRSRRYRSPEYNHANTALMDNELTSDSSLIEQPTFCQEGEAPPSYEDVLRNHQNNRLFDSQTTSLTIDRSTNSIPPSDAPPPYQLNKDICITSSSHSN